MNKPVMDRASASRKRISPTAHPFVPGHPIVSGRLAVPTPSPPTSAATGGTGPTLSRRVNLPANQVPCRYFAAGYCQRGEECYFKHDLASVKIPGLQARATEAEEIEREKEPAPEAKMGENCAICFEVPGTYGLLTSCDHIFCLTCIRAWRSTAAQDENPPVDPFGDPETGILNKTSKTCPLCRIRSKFIIPSSVYPKPPAVLPGEEDGERQNPVKEAIIAQYLAKLKTIPCRHFQNSLLPSPRQRPRLRHSAGNGIPDCPFGNDCHYSHQLERGVDYVFSVQQLAAQRHRRSGRRRGSARDPLNTLRMSWVNRILLGDYDTGDQTLPVTAWPASEEDARAIVEVFLESHPAGWDDYDDEDEDDDDDDDDDEVFYDDNDEYDPYYEDTDFEADYSEHDLEAEISRVFTLGDGPLSQAYRDSLSRGSRTSPPWASEQAEVGGEGAGRRRWNQHEALDGGDDVPALVDVEESE